MDDYSTILKEAVGATQKPESAAEQFPLQKTGAPEGALPKTMLLGFGTEGGIPKGQQFSNKFDFNISIREKFILRKRHWLVATLHNAVLKAVKKVELYVDTIDPEQPFNEETKKRMEEFASHGFGPAGEKEFRVKLVDTKKWNGDGWSEIVFDIQSGEPKLVNYLMAETMWLIPNEHGQIIGYPQYVDGVVNTIFSPENIIHLKEHSDEYSFYGYSDLDSLYVALLVDSLADEFDAETLKNFAVAPGVMSFDKDVDDTELIRLRWLFIKQHQQQPGKPIFLNNVKQWLPMSFDMKNLDLITLRKFVREKAMGLYGVLPMQAAVVETGKLANPEQQIEIGSEYIRQEMQTLETCYNLKFTPHFKASENLMFKFGDVDPKPDEERKAAETQKIKSAIAKELSTIPGAFTVDEVREVAGYEPKDDGTGTENVQQPIPQPFGAPGPAQEQPPPPGQEGKSTKPFAGYEDFQDCVDQNSDKEDPNAYCATIMHATESFGDERVKRMMGATKDFVQSPEAKMMVEEIAFLAAHKASRRENRAKFEASLAKINAKYSKEAIAAARRHYEEAKGKKTLGAFETVLAGIVAKLKDDMDKSIKKNATTAYKDSKTAIVNSFNQVDERAIATLLASHYGPLAASRDFSAAQKEGFVGVMRDAYQDGLSVPDMVKNMRNYSDAESYKLERLARTETNRFSNQGRFAGYQDLEQRRGEQYDYEWVGPQDDRTSEICTDIKSNNPYTLDNIMLVTDGGEPHINCRHNVVRVVK